MSTDDGTMKHASKSFISGCAGYFGVVAGAIILLIVIGLFLSAGSARDKARKQLAIQSTAGTHSANAESVDAPFKTYKLTDSFPFEGTTIFGSGKWTVTGFDFDKLDQFTSKSSYDTKTFKPSNGKYYFFVVSAKNEGDEKQDLHFGLTDDLVLVSSDGKKYSQTDETGLASRYQSYSGKFDDYYNEKEVNPGATAKAYALFDVPEKSYKLCMNDLDSFCIEGIE